MLWYTHIAFGFLLGIISMKFIGHANPYIFLIFAMVGALLPDIDTPKSKVGSKLGIISRLIKRVFGHRGIIHTIWGMFLICGLFWFFVHKAYGAALFVGFFSHLLIDGFTKKGISFMQPIAKLKISGFIESGSFEEKLMFILILAGIIIMLL